MNKPGKYLSGKLKDDYFFQTKISETTEAIIAKSCPKEVR